VNIIVSAEGAELKAVVRFMLSDRETKIHNVGYLYLLQKLLEYNQC